MTELWGASIFVVFAELTERTQLLAISFAVPLRAPLFFGGVC